MHLASGCCPCRRTSRRRMSGVADGDCEARSRRPVALVEALPFVNTVSSIPKEKPQSTDPGTRCRRQRQGERIVHLQRSAWPSGGGPARFHARSRRVSNDMPTGGGKRPRVLIADDHAQLLESASRLLSQEFHVVGAVSNGRQAVDVAQREEPDVVVLDVAMPDLDGFQTLQRLRMIGSRATVVFLSAYGAEEYVAAALRSGGRGYVLKTRMSSDLIAAVQHALAGRLFVPSLTALAASTAGGGHVAHFHLDTRFVLDAVSRFVQASLRSGESVVVVGTEATRVAIAQQAQACGMDLRAMEQRGQYVASDAAQGLSEVMCGDRPDEARLAEIIDSLERSRLESASGRPSRLIVFGEMAVPLCLAGNFDGALEIERVWNRLTAHLPIFTICSYPIMCFQNEHAQQQLPRLYAEHRAVSHTLNG